MLNFLKKNLFIDLLLSNILLLVIFFLIIFIEVKNSIKSEIVLEGSRANRKYITFFSLFTLIPSILISVFSLFLFSFALEKYFDKKITTAVDNSYKIAQNYVLDVRNKIESDIVLVAYDLNQNKKMFNANKKQFINFINTQQLIRNVDGVFLINSSGNLIISSSTNKSMYKPPSNEALKLVQNDNRPLKILDAYQNTSAALMRLTNYTDTFVYVVKYLDPKIAKYLTESREALSFYYTVQEKQTGIKLSFAIIYLIIVTLLLFLSISIAIRFSSRFFLSINNLISASNRIGEGKLNSKVPEIKTDKELEKLNKNFNLMIDRLKAQQNKLLTNERHEAWEHVARKIAHEIKNPLTPIQLIIDSLRNKYSKLLDKENQINFDENIKTINKQVMLIEKLVNEFSDFARMPKLIKNSIESINEKSQKNPDFIKKINIEIDEINDYIHLNIIDNGIGFNVTNLTNLAKPYYTTKKNGSGLGLSIVVKIINDHNGTIDFLNHKNGAKIKIVLPKINVS